MVGVYVLGRKAPYFLMLGFFVLFPTFLNAQINQMTPNAVGSFKNLDPNQITDAHFYRFGSDLFVTFTERRPSGECRRLDFAQMTNLTVSPVQSCSQYDSSAINIWYDVQGLSASGTWYQIGVVDICLVSSLSVEWYAYQLSYIGFNQSVKVMFHTQPKSFNTFLGLPVCN